MVDLYDIIVAQKLFGGSGGGGGSWTVLTEESVTTSVTEGDPYASGRITYVELITEDTIKITFNDMEYTCQKDSDGITNRFGAPWSDELNGYDFSVYPFAISSIGINGGAMNTLYTETAGTYTIKIEAPQSGGSSDFSTAEVYFENQLDHMVVFNMPSIIARDEPMATASVVVPDGATVRALIVLYQGKAIGGTDARGDCTASGDIVYDDTEGLFTITGDGGITIS